MEISCGLIRGRHSVPPTITEFIYLYDIPQQHICDATYMEDICARYLDHHTEATAINVYVTGFTPALLALIKVCGTRNIHVNAYNYDREGKKFWRQEVI